MKKAKTSLIIVLAIVLTFALCACEAGPFSNGTNTNGSGTTSSGTEITAANLQNLTVNASSVANYDASGVDELTYATTVADVMMRSTFEVNCVLNYTYKQTFGFGFGGSSSRTVSATQSTSGTAIALTQSGYLLTNAHVITVENASSYTDLTYTSWEICVSLSDDFALVDDQGASFYGLLLPCEVVCYDTVYDLAILKIKESGNVCIVKNNTWTQGNEYTLKSIQAAVFYDDSVTPLAYGQRVVAIGNAQGLGVSVTAGYVSKPSINGAYYSYSGGNLIMTSAPINSGDSGGPLTNVFCAVIGVDTLKDAEELSENMAFAIPSSTVISFVKAVMTTKFSTTVKVGSSTDGLTFSYTTANAYNPSAAKVWTTAVEA